ncbi:MAG: hypothetical protein IKY16_02485 [Bacteroidales bacterium]|nr:hypothetical protein [Bacteroidales bacterium]
MAQSKIVGLTISIEGKNSGIVKSLDEITKDVNKTTNSMKDLDKAMEVATDPQRVELAAEKQKLLTKAIEETEEKLKIMRQVAEDAKKGLEDGTVTREQYASLTAEIVKTEAGLRDLKDQANNTGEAMEEIVPEEAPEEVAQFTENVKKGGISLDDLKVAAAAAAPVIGTVVAVAATGIAVFAEVASAAMDAAIAVGDFLVDSAVTATEKLEDLLETLADFTNEGADYTDNLNTISKQTGINVSMLQELDYISKLVDVDLSTITGSMTRLEKSMGSAAKGSKDAVANFELLGVTIQNEDGTYKDLEETFWSVIEGLRGVDDQVTRDQIAMSLLGKSAKDLNPIISSSATEIADLRHEAYDMGYVLGDENIQAYQVFDDNMERIEKGVTGAKNALGLVLLPLLTDLSTDGVKLLGKFNTGLLQANGDIKKIGDVINSTVPGILQSILDNLPEAAAVVNDLVSTILGVLVENSPMILETLFSVLNTIFDTLLSEENIQNVFDSINIILTNIQNFLTNHGPQLIKMGADVFVNIINGIATTIPVLIPTMTEAITTIIGVLTRPDVVNSLIGAMVDLITATVNGIEQAIPTLEAAIPPLVDALCRAITVLSPLILSAGTTLLEALLDNGAVTEIIDTLAPYLIQIVVDMAILMYNEGPYLLYMIGKMFAQIADSAFEWGQDIIAELAKGVESKVAESKLVTGLTTAAIKIKGYLGFSVPDEGPLAEWGVNNPGADMIDLFAQGIDEELPELQSSLNLTAQTIAGGMSTDYSGQLAGINSSIQAIGGGQTIIPVYIGQERIETIVINANAANNYATGGR